MDALTGAFEATLELLQRSRFPTAIEPANRLVWLVREPSWQGWRAGRLRGLTPKQEWPQGRGGMAKRRQTRL